MSGPLVVIAHEASRTGGPRVLLELLRFAAPRLAMPISMRLLRNGPLTSELMAMDGGSDPAILPSAVLANSALAAEQLEEYPPSTPTMVYVHEDGAGLRGLPAAACDALVRRSNRVLAVSAAARSDLVELGVPGDRITVLPPVITARHAPSASEVAAARRALGGSGDRQLVVGCGEAGWRKGADLFVDLARRCAIERRDVDFAWVGWRPPAFGRLLDHDAAAVGISDRMRWVGQVDDPIPFLAAADLVVMTTRHDAQPLVPLEAATVGTPTVGWDIGGMNDLAIHGVVRTVPFPDGAALAEAVGRLLDDPSDRCALAEAGSTLVRDQRTVEVLGPRFVDEVNALVGPSGGLRR